MPVNIDHARWRSLKRARAHLKHQNLLYIYYYDIFLIVHDSFISASVIGTIVHAPASLLGING